MSWVIPRFFGTVRVLDSAHVGRYNLRNQGRLALQRAG